jgi:hypothetical protein
LFVGVMLQLSAPLRVNWFAMPPTGFRDGPIGLQELSTRSCAPPAQLMPAVENELHVRLEADVHELHGPHEPAVKPEKKLLLLPL